MVIIWFGSKLADVGILWDTSRIQTQVIEGLRYFYLLSSFCVIFTNSVL